MTPAGSKRPIEKSGETGALTGAKQTPLRRLPAEASSGHAQSNQGGVSCGLQFLGRAYQDLGPPGG